MTFGPVQMLILEFDSASLKGEILPELPSPTNGSTPMTSSRSESPPPRAEPEIEGAPPWHRKP